MVKRYEDHTPEINYDESRLGNAYRFSLESWDGWDEFRRLMPAPEETPGGRNELIRNFLRG